jgi:GNAT superfamily N-acetyltransferase
MTISIQQRPLGSGAICGAILAELGDWFGLPASNAGYEHLAQTGPAVIAFIDGEPGGLMLLKDHFSETLEIYLLAVRLARHRAGIGRALVEHAEASAAAAGARFLSVKTRGPSKPYEPYERTRQVYQALGFVALEEFLELWDPENPALFMAKTVRPSA